MGLLVRMNFERVEEIALHTTALLSQYNFTLFLNIHTRHQVNINEISKNRKIESLKKTI